MLLYFSTSALSRDDMLTVLIYLGEAFRDMLTVKKCGNARLLFYLSIEQADEDSYSFASETLLRLYNVADTMAEELTCNPNMNAFSARCACALLEAAL